MSARSDLWYARLVTTAKITLPLTSLAILSSLFLFAKPPKMAGSSFLNSADLSDYAQHERISRPRFAGMTPNGTAIQISAEIGAPVGNGPKFKTEDLIANIDTPKDVNVRVVAKYGIVDSMNMVAELSGGTSLVTTSGWRAETEGLDFALDKIDVTSRGAIRAEGPIGLLQAGSMTLRSSPDSPKDAPELVLIFQGGVKLIYTP